MSQNGNCFFCKSESVVDVNYDELSRFFACPVCGRYKLTKIEKGIDLDKNKTASYLFYNRFLQDKSDLRFHTTMSKEECDEYVLQKEKEGLIPGRPVHMDSTIIENWYPHSFNERINLILLNVGSRTKHIGDVASYCKQELYSLLFIDRLEENDDLIKSQIVEREEEYLSNEVHFITSFLEESDYIKAYYDDNDSVFKILLKPKAYDRIDELQKDKSNSKTAFVAMQFGDETLSVREAIRKGIKDAHYNPIFIDEVQHNEFIVPEILKNIRDSRFLVVDLTNENRGAYFEEGYAMGLNKPVIQICKEGVHPHFDVAQKNTIMWEKEEDISERLCNRIKATID